MGDYYWYGCEGTRDPVMAASYYTNAAERGDPHVCIRSMPYYLALCCHILTFLYLNYSHFLEFSNKTTI